MNIRGDRLLPSPLTEPEKDAAGTEADGENSGTDTAWLSRRDGEM